MSDGWAPTVTCLFLAALLAQCGACKFTSRMAADCHPSSGCCEETLPSVGLAAVLVLWGPCKTRDHNCTEGMHSAYMADRRYGWFLQGPFRITSEGMIPQAWSDALLSLFPAEALPSWLAACCVHAGGRVVMPQVQMQCMILHHGVEGVIKVMACAGCSILGRHLCNLRILPWSHCGKRTAQLMCMAKVLVLVAHSSSIVRELLMAYPKVKHCAHTLYYYCYCTSLRVFLWALFSKCY